MMNEDEQVLIIAVHVDSAKSQNQLAFDWKDSAPMISTNQADFTDKGNARREPIK